jgi:hypothetical protein
MSLGARLCFPTLIDASANLDEVRALDPEILPMPPRVFRSMNLQAGQKGEKQLEDRLFGPSAMEK